MTDRPAARRPLALLAVIGCVALTPRPALARTTGQLFFTGSAAATDNLLSRLSEDLADPATAGAFFNLSPRVTLQNESRLLIHQLVYNFSLDLYASNLDATSYANRLRWDTLIQVTPATLLTLALQGNQGKESTALLLGDAAATRLMARPQGPVMSAGGELIEHLTFELSPAWTAFQELSFMVNYPIEATPLPPTSYGVNGSGGVGRRWDRDVLEGALRVNYMLSSHPADELQPSRDDHQIIIGLLATWRRDISTSWSSEVGGGLSLAMQADQAGEPLVQPTALAGITYTREEGTIGLAAAHRLEANTAMGRIYQLEEVRLAGGLPIDRAGRFRFSLSTGYQYGQGVNLDAQVYDEEMHNILADAALAVRLWGSWELTARYQLTWQRNWLATDEAPRSLLRQVGLLSLSFAFPEEVLTIAMPSSSRRVDANDTRRNREDSSFSPQQRRR